MNFAKKIEFICEIDKLKSIIRRNKILSEDRLENVAEHSWHLALMANTLYDSYDKTLDISKVTIMLLIHDLVEIYAGDTYLYDDRAREDKKKREEDAANKIYSILDDKSANFYKNLWFEFDEAKTEEAIFANMIDRLQPVILNYYSGGQAWKDNKIKISQVKEKNEILLNGPDVFKIFFLDILNKAIEKKYLIDE